MRLSLAKQVPIVVSNTKTVSVTPQTLYSLETALKELHRIRVLSLIHIDLLPAHLLPAYLVPQFIVAPLLETLTLIGVTARPRATPADFRQLLSLPLVFYTSRSRFFFHSVSVSVAVFTRHSFA